MTFATFKALMFTLACIAFVIGFALSVPRSEKGVGNAAIAAVHVGLLFVTLVATVAAWNETE